MTPEQIRQWRLDLGLTQAEAAELIGVKADHFGRAERGVKGLSKSAVILMKKIKEEKKSGGD